MAVLKESIQIPLKLDSIKMAENNPKKFQVIHIHWKFEKFKATRDIINVKERKARAPVGSI